MKFIKSIKLLSLFKVDLSDHFAQPEDFIYLLLDDSECLVNFLDHFENVNITIINN